MTERPEEGNHLFSYLSAALQDARISQCCESMGGMREEKVTSKFSGFLYVQ